MRIGDSKNFVLATLSKHRQLLLDERQVAIDTADKMHARIDDIDKELDGIQQTEKLIQDASHRGE